MGSHVLGHAAPKDALEERKSAAADNDRVEAALLRDTLDRPRRIAGVLDELGFDVQVAKLLLRLEQLPSMDLRIVARVDRCASRVDRDDADDAQGRPERAGELGGGSEGLMGRLATVIRNEDLLDDRCAPFEGPNRDAA
jgi:hypothetical protein